jgi:predicted transcriptional regulator
MENFMDGFNILKLLQARADSDGEPKREARVFPTDLSGINAALPSIAPKYRRIFKIAVKLTEIQMMLERFDAELREKLGDEDDFQRNLLFALQENGEEDGEKKDRMDLMMKIIDARNVLRFVEALNEPSG